MKEKWLYFVKHAEELTAIPDEMKEPEELVAAFAAAQKMAWSREELFEYDRRGIYIQDEREGCPECGWTKWTLRERGGGKMGPSKFESTWKGALGSPRFGQEARAAAREKRRVGHSRPGRAEEARGGAASASGHPGG